MLNTVFCIESTLNALKCYIVYIMIWLGPEKYSLKVGTGKSRFHFSLNLHFLYKHKRMRIFNTCYCHDS
jgi:hypothetical protein